MKHTFLSLLVLASLATSAQKSKDKELPEVLDSTMKVVVTEVFTAEDFFRVDTREISTGNGYWFECRSCHNKRIPNKGDTLTLVRPQLMPAKKPTRRFIFN